MAFKDVMNLRKSGNLSEAYEMALSDYQNVQNIWTKRALSWCIFDGMKANATYAQKEQFLSKLHELTELELPADETMFWNNIIWPINAYVRDCANTQNINEDVFSTVLELIKGFPFERPSKEYSVLLGAFLKVKNWHNITLFLDWWDFENLREEDFVCEVVNGKKMPTSLAENTYLAYAKCLLANRDVNAISSFIPKMQELANNHPNMTFTNYYIGKLLLAIGSNTDDILSVAIPFVRKKNTEFWAWQLLAETCANDEDKYLACLLRAINCRTSDDFLVNIYLMLAKAFRNRHCYADARYYLDKYIQVKNNTGSKISPEANDLSQENWYVEVLGQQPTFEMDYMSITNDIIFSDCPETDAVITFVNKDKCIATVMYGVEKIGFFKYSRFMKKVYVGTCLKIRIESVSGEGRMNLYSAKTSNMIETDFYKNVTGAISSNAAQTAYFLKSDNESYYIPKDLIEKNGLKIGEIVSANIIYSYNKSRSQWNWSCLKVRKID